MASPRLEGEGLPLPQRWPSIPEPRKDPLTPWGRRQHLGMGRHRRPCHSYCLSFGERGSGGPRCLRTMPLRDLHQSLELAVWLSSWGQL